MFTKNYKKNKATRAKKKEILKKVVKPLPEYIKEADRLFSKLIRKIYTEADGALWCYTCDRPLVYNEAQCGHFISRSELALRWSLDNCRVQCNACNSKHETDPQIFKEVLEHEIPGITSQLQEIARLVAKPTRGAIIELISELKSKLKET